MMIIFYVTTHDNYECMILCVSQNNIVTTIYDIFHLYISYHSSSSIYVDLIALVADVICYYTTSTINKYFLSYFILYVKIKVLDTYWVIVSSPKQFDIKISKVTVTETAHWILKAWPYLKN